MTNLPDKAGEHRRAAVPHEGRRGTFPAAFFCFAGIVLPLKEAVFRVFQQLFASAVTAAPPPV
jgi:hypothetical protein